MVTVGLENIDRVREHLIPGERPGVVVRRHPVAVLEPVLTGLAAVLALGYVALAVNPAGSASTEIVVVATIAVLLRTAYKLWWWRREWFVATDRRIMLISGIVDSDVAMMSIAKVTDMTYHSSTVGMLLRYGTFIVESAGQTQALREVRHIPGGRRTYTAVVGIVNRRPGDDEWDGEDDGSDLGEDDPTSRLAMSRVTQWYGQRRRDRRDRRGRPPHGSIGARHGPVEDDPPARSLRDLFREPGAARGGAPAESLYRSADLDPSFGDDREDPTGFTRR